MARRSIIDKRKLRASLQRELALEASRMMPALARDIARAVLPPAVTLAKQRAEILYENTAQNAAQQTSSPSQAGVPRSSTVRQQTGALPSQSLAVDVDGSQIREAADALDRLAVAFDTVAIKGGKMDAMLRDATTGLAQILVASDGDAAKKALGALLKDLGTQAISGVQAMLLAAEAQAAVKGVLSFGTSLAVDAPLIAAAYVALEGAKAWINSLDRGGVLVGDQLILAHDKETVIPYEKAPAFFAEAVNRGAGARDTLRSVYRPEEQSSTAARVRVSFGDMRGALRQSEIRQSRRSA